jgi:hypothetical protein
MSKKWLCLAAWALMWAGMAGCAQDFSRQTAKPPAPPSQTAQPAGKPTLTSALVSATTTVLPLENAPLDLTPSPQTAGPVLQGPLKQTQKETVESARKDLAQRLGISVEAVTVLSVIGQDYSSDAFYCRTTKGRISRDEPALVISGETILLEVRGSRYEYHANDPLVVYCRQLQ